MDEKTRQSKIIHVDMDCFFAQVEIRDNPKLIGKPVVISGPPNSRSVVCTASYEARVFGVGSGMSSYEANKKCPNAIFITPNFNKYKVVSDEINKIFKKYTDLIEPLSLDEAYLDVTVNKKGEESATRIAQMIQNEIFTELNLTCSIGVSYNKFIAKIASDFRKPSGITVVPPQHANDFLKDLEIRKFPGVGKKGIKKFYDYGIYKGSDFQKLSLEKAEKYFGKLGTVLYYRVRGIDHTRLVVNREVKSIGFERTLKTDIATKLEVLKVFGVIVKHNEERLRNKKKWAKTITIKIKFDDFTQITRSKTLAIGIRDANDIFLVVSELLGDVDFEGKKIRLLGTSGSNLVNGLQKKRIKVKIFEQLLLDLKF